MAIDLDKTFPCDPSALLSALSGMKPSVGYVYTIVLMRIYETGGACMDGIEALARRAGINKRCAADALNTLLITGKLVRDGDGLHNEKAREILAGEKMLFEKRKNASQKAISQRWQKSQSNQTNGDTNRIRIASESHNAPSLLDTIIDSESNNLGRVKRRKSKPGTLIAADWKLSNAGAKFADVRGFRGQQLRNMVERFVNYHLARGEPSADWDASWRTWVLKQIEFSQKNGTRPNGRGNGHVTLTDLAMGRNEHHDERSFE